MRFAVETWAPDYGQPVDDAVLGEPAADVDLAVEVPPDDWAPITPAAAPAARVLFVDGVQRVDANVWITGDDGASHVGVFASWGAGVVVCDGDARVEATEVRRGVLVPGQSDLDAVVTAYDTYHPYSVRDDDSTDHALNNARGDLEVRVAGEFLARARAAGGGAAGEGAAGGGAAGVGAAGGDELIVVDGPVRGHRHLPGAAGYVKAHHVAYLPPARQLVVGALRAGQRTPLFALGGQPRRWSWYLRLPGPATHPWWGVVRCEAAGPPEVADAAALADRVAATLPRFASQPHNDPRAPQNLHPIAGLERELRRRLGDALLLERALHRAAAAGAA